MSSVAALPFSAWPAGRKVAAGVFAVGGYVALTCAAVYLAGVLFLVLNKANPKQAQFTSIVHYWDLYADDAQLRKKLQLAIGVSGIGLLILLPAVGWMYWMGDTGWATALLVWSLIVGSLDNFLRPMLIKRGADLPLLLIFAGVIGGMLSFGLIGIFVGPVVLAVTYTLLEAWIDDTQPRPFYVIPRQRDVVLGGCAQHGDVDAAPREADTLAIRAGLARRVLTRGRLRGAGNDTAGSCWAARSA